jgi:predicted metal-dependent HD superfamily phosphohydrolase
LFLKSQLEKGIFHTPYFKHLYEEQAGVNIQKEIEWLNKKN